MTRSHRSNNLCMASAIAGTIGLYISRYAYAYTKPEAHVEHLKWRCPLKMVGLLLFVGGQLSGAASVVKQGSA